jgi:TP901 family phage tail tape measure protein
MADAISELVVKITGDASDLESTITSVTGELESLSKVQGGSNSTTTTGTKGLAAYQKQMEKAGETLSTSRTALTNAKKAYEDNTKSISANVSTLKSQQAEINKTISVRSAEKNLLTEANKYLDKNSDAYKDNQKAIKWINNEISAYTEQSDKITESIQTQESVLAGSKKAYEEAQSAVSTATEKYKEYESGLKSVERAAKAQNLQNAGKQLKDVGEGLDSITKPVQYAAAGLAAGGVAAAKFAIDFEDNFANVKKTVDGTDEQFAQIKQDIIDMTTVGINGHSAIPQTTAELTELAAAGGQLGIQTENISSFTETMAMLGTATNLYGEEGAATLAKFANVTKMSQNDFDRLGSSLVALGNNFATNEADIASMSMRLAGAGTQIGLSQADILGIATALSSVGIEAEAGGSAFSKAMIAMQSATSTGFTQINSVTDKTGMSLRDLQLLSSNSSKDFKALADGLGYTSDELNAMIKSGVQLENFAKITGRTSEEFKNLFESNPSEAIDAFIKGLQNADSSGESAIAMLQDMGFTEVRLRDSLLRLANSEAGVTDAVTMSNEAWKENTALQNEFNAKAETTASKIAVVKQNFVEAARGIGETMLPTINDVSSGAVQFAQKLASLDDTQKKTLVNTAAGVVAVGAASKGAVSVIKGVGSAIEGLGKIKGTKVFETIAAGISAIPAPAALAVAGIAALGVAAKVGYDAWYNSQYKWSEGLSEGNEQISESLDKYKQISSLQGEIKDLKLVIENPDSSAEQVEKAKSRLEEIKELLSQEYNLVIKSDNSNLDDAVEKVKNVSKNELQSNINNQMAKLAELRGKMASYEGDYAKDYAEYEKQLNNQTRSSELVNNITAINQAYKEGNITGWERDEQVRELAKSYGMLNTEAMSYNTILNTANGNLKYASGQVEEYKQRLGELTAAHDEYVAVSTEMANWETELRQVWKRL